MTETVCSTCNGNGKVPFLASYASKDPVRTCPKCLGTGKAPEKPAQDPVAPKNLRTTDFNGA